MIGTHAGARGSGFTAYGQVLGGRAGHGGHDTAHDVPQGRPRSPRTPLADEGLERPGRLVGVPAPERGGIETEYEPVDAGRPPPSARVLRRAIARHEPAPGSGMSRHSRARSVSRASRSASAATTWRPCPVSA